jgi:hypothetical protein
MSRIEWALVATGLAGLALAGTGLYVVARPAVAHVGFLVAAVVYAWLAVINISTSTREPPKG